MEIYAAYTLPKASCKKASTADSSLLQDYPIITSKLPVLVSRYLLSPSQGRSTE
jgi:hypothetical protein